MPEETKKCPCCAEEIKANAVKCKHCGSILSVPPTVLQNALGMSIHEFPE